MQIENAVSYIEELRQQEPWRGETSKSDEKLCTGAVADLEWDGSKYWHCTACGRIGHSTFPIHGIPPASPVRLTAKDLARLLSP